MSKVEGEGAIDPPLKASCNYFFLDASRVKYFEDFSLKYSKSVLSIRLVIRLNYPSDSETSYSSVSTSYRHFIDVLTDESSTDGFRPVIRPNTGFISSRITRLRRIIRLRQIIRL